MKRLWQILRILLDIWGGLCLVGIVVLGVLVGIALHSWTGMTGPKVDHAGPQDLIFILNEGNLAGKSNIVEVIHSYESGRESIDGDHCNAYCIKIDQFPESAVGKDEYGEQAWIAGPVENAILKDAIDNACGWPKHDKLHWFPSKEEVNSKRYYISFRQIIAYNQRVEAVRMIAYDTQEKLLYYSDISW